MKAMILAAGLGTRLRPLTNDRPKALLQVGGRTLLEITLDRLRKFGVRDVIVNVHHFADMVIDYLQANNNFGLHIEISREEILLDTGGGLKKASSFFLQESNSSDEPFFLHNVDVLTTIDLDRMLQLHRENQALVTLAVQHRETSRYLLFDEQNRLCGRRRAQDSAAQIVRPSAHLQPLAFSGVHVISSRFLSLMTEDGAFSIIDSYLRVAATGERIVAFRADEYYWRDLGKPENVAQAELDLEQKRIRL